MTFDISDWQSLLAGISPRDCAELARLAGAESSATATLFYDSLLSDPKLALMLRADVVNVRLHAALQRWVIDLLSVDETTISAVIAAQREAGALHARIEIAFDQILRAMRVIKQSLAEAALRHMPERADRITLIAHRLIDLSIEEMARQYSEGRLTALREKEAYHLHLMTSNAALERARQGAVLADWSNAFLRHALIDRRLPEGFLLGRSSFGLWMRHRAAAVLQSHGIADAAQGAIAEVDLQLLPACRAALAEGATAKLHLLVSDVTQAIERLKAQLETMFTDLAKLEAGKDSLTQLLNRRFLKSILQKEIDLARTTGRGFAAIMIDIDDFKEINDRLGHAVGDQVLAQIAEVMSSCVRPEDFLFRHGGEEFLLVLVEAAPEDAAGQAEALRRRVEGSRFPVGPAGELSATISLGVASYDGHPDYRRLIERADQALYAAKSAGKNAWRVAASGDEPAV